MLLRNIKTNRLSKKLDWLFNKYPVITVPSLLTVRLNVPKDLYKTFYVKFVKWAASDLLLSQNLTNTRPAPVLTLSIKDLSQNEYEMEAGKGKGEATNENAYNIGLEKSSWNVIKVIDTNCSYSA